MIKFRKNRTLLVEGVANYLIRLKAEIKGPKRQKGLKEIIEEVRFGDDKLKRGFKGAEPNFVNLSRKIRGPGVHKCITFEMGLSVCKDQQGPISKVTHLRTPGPNFSA